MKSTVDDPLVTHSSHRTLLPPAECVTKPRRNAVTLRAILIGMLLVPFVAFWATAQYVDIILSLLVPPVATLLPLLLLNAPLRRWAPRWALGEGEFVLIYAMLSVGCALAAEWSWYTNPLIYSYALFADETNRFSTLILPFLSPLFFIKEKSALPGFREGGHSLSYMLAHLGPWWVPIGMWTLFVTLLAMSMLCICSLFRREWTDREKLSFPVIQLPVALTAGAGDSPLWRSPVLWSAFGAMFAIDMLNGFAFLYPTLIPINLRTITDLAPMFPDAPWNAIGSLQLGIFPFIAAMAVFLPSDLLFSTIFFFFFRKAEQIGAASIGYPQGTFGGGGLVPSPPYFSEQSWGAFMGLFIMALWIARHYLREVWTSIRTGEATTGEEMLPHRWAFAGLLLCLAGLAGIGGLIGLSPLFVLGYLLLFLAFSAALTRMRAELGPPTHEMAYMGPNQLIVDLFGTKGLPAQYIPNLASQFYFINRIHRSHPMPYQLEAMKMAERPGMVYLGFFVAIALAVVVGSVSAHAVWIYRGYRWGAEGGDVWSSGAVVADLHGNPRDPNRVASLFMLLGMAMVFGLSKLRFAFPGFPLNPVGYALGMNYGVDYYWFGLLVALILKVGVQRYGGMKGYRRLHLLALGVMLGEYAAEAIWSIVGIVFHFQTFTISLHQRIFLW